MRSANKRMLISFLALVIALMFFTTTTYAWFAMSATPSVEHFNIHVTTQDSLYISASINGPFKSYVSKEELAYHYDFTTILLDSVSPRGYMVGDQFILSEPFALTDVDQEAPTTGSYYSFNLYFMSLSKYIVTLEIGNSHIKSEGSGKSIPSPKNYSSAQTGGIYVPKDTPLIAAAQNAARIAFIGDVMAIYDLNFNKGFSSWDGVNVAHDYYEFINGVKLTPEQTVEYGSVINVADGKYDVAGTIPAMILTLNKENEDTSYYTGRLKVYLWVEGKDADCFNSIFSDKLDVALQFYGIYINEQAE